MSGLSGIRDQVVGTRGRHLRTAVEALTLVVLAVPPAWLALQWTHIPAVSPHLHHGRMSLWVMPLYCAALYFVLGEYGLMSRMDILRSGRRLARLRPTFLAYFLTCRLEVLAFLGVLSLAMDRTAVTGHPWAAKGFISASLTIIVLTIVFFIILGARFSYTMARTSSQ